MTLTDAVLSLHPSAIFGTDFVVGQTLVDDKVGPEAILMWNEESLGKQDDDAIAAALSQPTPAAVPEEISRRQFYQQLAIDGDISQDEALDAAAGIALPQKIADAVATIPQNQQFSAKMLLRTASVFQRSHPMVPILGAALKKDGPLLDDLWIAAAAL